MKHALSDSERDQLNQRIAETESRTNSQIVLAVIKRSDSYTEIPWKAFALGSSFAGLLFFILFLLLNYRASPVMILAAITTTLLAGAVFALLAVFISGFAKLFLSAHRSDMEVRQYAESLFLSHELFSSDRRMGILVLVSMFERQVILLPDKGIGKRLSQKAMQEIIIAMTFLLKRNEVKAALEEGLSRLSMILEISTNDEHYEGNVKELSNKIIEENGV